MRRLTLRERDVLVIGATDGLSEAQGAAFARLAPSLPAGSLTWNYRAIRFGPFCGVLRAADITVELLPKIDDTDNLEAARGLLVAMLRATGNLTVSKAGEAALGQQKLHLLDQFILDFCARVNAALRGGVIIRYQEHQENLNALRGRLILTDHLRRNVFNQSQLFCNFDERTINNSYNSALKAVLTSLRLHAISAQTKATVGILLHRFDDVCSRPTTPQEISSLSFDRMTRHWEPVFERAKWLLQGLFPDVRSGVVDGTCLLFNMERLFEGFLGEKIRHAWQRSPRSRFQVILQGPSRHLAESFDGEVFRLRPDISILDDRGVVTIFDAKWKKLDAAAIASSVSSPDVYQLASYASRYGCDRVALVYPASATCRPGLLGSFKLKIPGFPRLEIHALDVQQLAYGGELPVELSPPAPHERAARAIEGDSAFSLQ